MIKKGKDIFTIGHSTHPFDLFIKLLKNYNIEVLVDVRSNPYSTFSPQFDKNNIKKAVEDSGIKYLYFGKELGGRPKEKEFYDSKGHINYTRLSKSSIFLKGIYRLEKGLHQYRIAIMCSEEDPSNCHRTLLVGRVLIENGFAINHIRGNGELERQEKLSDAIEGVHSKNQQLSLF